MKTAIGVLIVVTGVIIVVWVITIDTEKCCQDPGVPSPLFPQACPNAPRWSLSRVPFPDAVQFSITAQHAVWRDSVTGVPGGSLYFVEYDPDCKNGPTPAQVVTGTAGSQAQDAIPNRSNPTQSYIYFDNQGNDLRGAILPQNTNFSPLPAAATIDQKFPGGAAHDGGFAWEEDGEIWICSSARCNSVTAFRVTTTSDYETNPRIYGPHLVWENVTTGEVMYATGPNYSQIDTVDQGAQPDVHHDWMVYAKQEPAPSIFCDWSFHWQLWAYGPLSNNPQRMRLSAVTYWGAANYTAPRLTDDYVVFLVDFICTERSGPKTVVGIYPIAGFGDSTVQMMEVDDAGDIAGNVDAWQEPGSPVVHVLYRKSRTDSATLACCTVPF